MAATGTTAELEVPMPDATALQADRPAAIPTGMPTSKATTPWTALPCHDTQDLTTEEPIASKTARYAGVDERRRSVYRPPWRYRARPPMRREARVGRDALEVDDVLRRCVLQDVMAEVVLEIGQRHRWPGTGG